MGEALARILIVDDEFSVRDSLANWFQKDGYEVESAADANEALEHLQAGHFDVVLLDIKMPGMDGMELQERIHSLEPETPVIMITAFASVETAVRALKQGAFDYVTKPVDPDELSHLVTRALETKRLQNENVRLRQTIDELVRDDEIVGESPAIGKVIELIGHVAKTDARVLILGESGTGKELIARAIHANSPRRYFPIVPVNCGAFPADLLEDELFGHEKGAFTGAQQRRKGRVEMANGGTLFLDEVGAIPQKMQVDLLRVIESGEFTRLGASHPTRADFRVICATNEDLQKEVAEGRFREDFFYRINVFSITAPPLRDRRSDIPLLANHFLTTLSNRMDKTITGISPEAMDLLIAYDWPGNVRELRNAIERAMVVGTQPVLRRQDLPVWGGRHVSAADVDTLASVEKRHVSNVLDRTGWNITRAAEILAVDRVTVYNKIKKYGLEPPAARVEGR